MLVLGIIIAMTLEIPSWLFIANIFARLYFMTALEGEYNRRDSLICVILIFCSLYTQLTVYICIPITEGTERPPERPPDDIIDELTMYHKIPLEFYYVDDTNGGKGIQQI